jgi:hypothetical protein
MALMTLAAPTLAHFSGYYDTGCPYNGSHQLLLRDWLPLHWLTSMALMKLAAPTLAHIHGSDDTGCPYNGIYDNGCP